jgi:hypothetical protein
MLINTSRAIAAIKSKFYFLISIIIPLSVIIISLTMSSTALIGRFSSLLGIFVIVDYTLSVSIVKKQSSAAADLLLLDKSSKQLVRLLCIMLFAKSLFSAYNLINV